ncbi:MAG: T9SS type A sorting domain-containing protein [Bacteroidota bacterium]
MKKFYVSCLMLALMVTAAMAQTSLTIRDIQTKSAMELGNCDDLSPFEDSLVRIRCVVTTKGGEVYSGSDRRWIWVQDGNQPFSGLNVRHPDGNTATTPDDILDLLEGDSIEIVGTVSNFNGETQIEPTGSVTLIGTSDTVSSTLITVGDLNDDQRNNNLVDGEQYEGMFVELRDLTVTGVDNFSPGRFSFEVSGPNGNRINIGDRFIAQRTGAFGGSFVPPNVGDRFDFIKGVVSHSKNDCPGSNGRGYELLPYKKSHYQIAAGFASPQVSGLTRTPVTPSGSQDVTIQALIQDTDGTVDSADLFYAVGQTNNNYIRVRMTQVAGGSTYEGTIPATAYSDGDFVKYYLGAYDNDGLRTFSPNVPSGAFDPIFFFVRDNGTRIFDIQFTPYTDGNSGYEDLSVTVQGVVTASVGDLGFVYIQEEGQFLGWTGISCIQNAGLSSLQTGQLVEVTGVVEEFFGLTRLGNISSIQILDSNKTVAPIDLDPTIMTSYDFATNEQYEGMLVRFVNPMGGPIFVADSNADSQGGNNFGEYRIGLDDFDPLSGSRVLTGRSDNNGFSSLNVGYINDSSWITNAGLVNVPVCIVSDGDTMDSVTGVMTYSFGNMKLLPRTTADYANYRGANCANGLFPVSVEDELADRKVEIFPNPVQDELHLRYNFPRSVRAEASLRDLMGRKVQQVTFKGQQGELRFDTRDLPSGTYFMTVSTENTLLERKQIVVIK